MGLFDYFSQEGKLKRHARRMADRDALPEDRDASARWLANEGSRPAIAGLLRRFDVSLSQQMKDRTEKEQVHGLLVDMGEDVVEPLTAWLQRCKQYAWPLKLMTELQGDRATVEVALALLDGPAGKATFEPERRKELLVWLAEQRHEGIVPGVSPFLKDFDEEVRFAAAEVLVAQEDDAAREPLLAVLGNAEEESLRLKHRLARIFQQRSWAVDGVDLSGALPDGFRQAGDRIVAA